LKCIVRKFAGLQGHFDSRADSRKRRLNAKSGVQTRPAIAERLKSLGAETEKWFDQISRALLVVVHPGMHMVARAAKAFWRFRWPPRR
jgi:hypothetical protein